MVHLTSQRNIGYNALWVIACTAEVSEETFVHTVNENHPDILVSGELQLYGESEPRPVIGGAGRGAPPNRGQGEIKDTPEVVFLLSQVHYQAHRVSPYPRRRWA